MNKLLRQRMKDENYSLVSIDLFSGPGGLCTGFKWAGVLPLIAVEWTDSTSKTYSLSHNAEIFELNEYDKNGVINDDYLNKFCHESAQSVLIHGDINKVSSSMIKRLLAERFGIDSKTETVDIVSGGAPCESFSMAGKRAAGDERDDLFSNILRISRTLKAKSVLFENVKGLFSKAKNGKKGAIFDYICNSFEDKNSTVSYKLMSRNPATILLKASDYGVPQSRERLFLIGIRSDLDDIAISYPAKEYGPGTGNPYVTSWDAIEDLPYVEMGQEETKYTPLKEIRNENQRRFISIMRGTLNDDTIHTKPPKHLIKQKLYNENSVSVHKAPGHIKRKMELLALIRENESMKTAQARLRDEGTLEQYQHLFPKTMYGCRNRRLIKTEPSFTVTSHCLDEILHPFINRAISPREAARLQSFPDWYQFYGPYVQFHGAKEQDKYEQIGDAIPPLLAYALARQFIEALPKHNK